MMVVAMIVGDVVAMAVIVLMIMRVVMVVRMAMAMSGLARADAFHVVVVALLAGADLILKA